MIRKHSEHILISHVAALVMMGLLLGMACLCCSTATWNDQDCKRQVVLPW